MKDTLFYRSIKEILYTLSNISMEKIGEQSFVEKQDQNLTLPFVLPSMQSINSYLCQKYEK